MTSGSLDVVHPICSSALYQIYVDMKSMALRAFDPPWRLRGFRSYTRKLLLLRPPPLLTPAAAAAASALQASPGEHCPSSWNSCTTSLHSPPASWSRRRSRSSAWPSRHTARMVCERVPYSQAGCGAGGRQRQGVRH